MTKDAWDNRELGKILGISESAACKVAMSIRRKIGDRLGIKGKIHAEDYFEYFGISDRTRYAVGGKEKEGDMKL